MRSGFGLKEGILGLCWWLGLFHLARAFSRDKLRILCYHGFDLDGESRFRPKLFMSRDTFRERLALLARYRFPVVPLEGGVAGLREGSLPPDAVVITIDDGHYSTQSVAAPLLESHGFSATVYVTTYYAEKQTPVFNLMVEYLLWKTRRPWLELSGLTWARNQRVDLREPAERERIARDIIEYGEQCGSNERREAISCELGALLDIDYEALRRARMLSLMSLDEIRGLVSRGFDIQLHTHRHRFPESDEAVSKQEIADNRRVLETVVDTPRRHFCYPSGLWSECHRPWLAELGIESAATCMLGLNDRRTPLFALRRIVDGEDVSRIEFLAEVFGFTEILRRLRDRIRRKAVGG